MPVEDREVLEYLGEHGKSRAAIGQRFPGFDLRRLVRAGLAEEVRRDDAATEGHGPTPSGLTWRFALTERGAAAVGIDSDTLDFS